MYVIHALNYLMYNLIDGVSWFDQYKITKVPAPYNLDQPNLGSQPRGMEKAEKQSGLRQLY